MYYGALTVDHRSGTSYFGETWNPDNIVKVNALGIQTAMFNNSGLLCEIFRMKFDYINNQVVIGGGNLNYTDQAGTIDTSLTNLIPYNVLNATGLHHDMCLIALDDIGNAYMAPAKALGSDSSKFDNVLIRLPLPVLVPATYMIPDGYTFIEASSIGYYPKQTSNGFNGMVANKSAVDTYDGATLKKWLASTGAFVKSAMVSTTPFKFGGLDMDCEDNLYVANNNEVVEYDSSLNALSTVSISPDTIYSLAISSQGQLYTCGNQFVQSTSVPVCTVMHTTETKCGEVFVPNAFSPNNDGQNDILYVLSNCIKTMDFIVVDRWGNKVFESGNINNGWDGTYKGQPMNTGTYAYYLKATMQDGSSVEKHGNVTLVR
jgi:gliding motility-associated-like protein